MMEENQSIMRNDLWKLDLRLVGKLMVTCKWIYNINHVADDGIEKYKEIFVAK
jgi:hypothetical protein